jgi:all-trans-retinol dehydrogenase (NAD+)
MKQISGKIAVVTGAAMGMGKSLSARLMAEGCSVAMVDIKADGLNEAVARLSQNGVCRPYLCDISDRRAVYSLAGTIKREMGPVSILVNNAGIVNARPLMDLDDDVIEKIITINLTSMFWTCKAFLPGMISAGEGHVVNMASAGGILALPTLSVYCASKFGVVGFTDALRQEMAKLKYNINFTVVCPNTVGTGMFSGSKMVAGTKLLKADDVTAKIISGIRKNRAMVAVPSIPVKILTPLAKLLLPVRWMDGLNRMMGMWDANDTWIGG